MSLKNLFSSAGGASSDVLETEVISTASIRDVFGDNSCVALYQFNGDATDTSGNFNGTASNVTYGAGKFGQCAVFNGSAYVSSSYLINPNGNSYSFSFWFSFNSGNTNIFGIQNTTTYSFLFAGIDSSNIFKFFAYGGTGQMVQTQALSPSTLYHCVCTIDFTTKVKKVYINGTLAGSNSSFDGVETFNKNLVIGGIYNQTAPSASFNGSIDQFRIFNRALTAEEVAVLYVEEKTVVKETVREFKDLVDPFLDKSGVALYKMDGNAQDAGGLYNGTPTNMSYTSGKFGDCATFTGDASKYFTTTLTLPAVSSVSYWVKRNSSLDTGNVQAICGTNGDYFNCGSEWVLLRNSATWVIRLSGGEVPVSDSGVWHHICFTDNGSKIDFFVDGVKKTNIGTYASLSGLPITQIGKGGQIAGSTLNGQLDQLRIFNRELTAEDVAMLYEEREDLTLGKDTQHLIDPFGDKSGVALYEFNGDAKDTGGAFNGTASNITYGEGKFGQCVQNSSSTGYVSFGIHHFNVPKTVSFWGKDSIRIQNGKNKLALPTIDMTNTSFVMYTCNGVSGCTGQRIKLTYSIDLTTFRHICVTINYPTVIIYVDGAILASGTMSGTVGSSVYDFGLWDIGGHGEALPGSIDQVRIFNRALTAEEVAVLYTEKKPQVSTINLTDPFGDNSAVALYKMDGNALDAGGSYNGTASGVTYEEGKLGHCAVFNGTYANINTGYNYGSLFALSVWIKTTTSLGWVANSYTSDTAGGGLVVESNVIKLEFGGGILMRDLYGTKVVNDGAWHHVVALSNGTTGTIYVDGVLDVSSPFVHYNSSGNIYLGKRGTLAYYFSGRVDQVRFFKRMLSQEEVEILYNEKPNDTTEEGLVAYYPLQVSAQDAQSTFEGTATGVTFDGDSAYFNGTSSQISIPSIVSKFNTQSIFGVSLWFKGTQTSVPVGLFSVRNLASDSIVLLLALNRTVAGDIGLDSSAAGAFLTLGTYNGGFNNGIWHHCYVDINFTNKTFNIFVDGKLVSSGTNASLVKSTGASYAYIGCNYLSQYFAGNLDEVRVYERTLTAQEVSDLYNNGRHIEESLLPSIPQTSLVAHFPLDINATDVVGAFDGVATGVTFDGDSAYFGSSGSYIKVLSSPVSSNTWSVSFWIKPSSNHNKAIFDFSSSRAAFVLNGNDVFSFYDGKYVEFTYAPPLNVFTQVSLVFEGTSLKLYVNGVLHSSKTIAGVIPSGFMTLGSFFDYTYGLTGNLDDLRVYERALTAQEVSDIYNYGR